MALAWADRGTALIGVDSTGHFGVQPVDGGAFQPFRGPAVNLRELLAEWTSAMAVSSDGRTGYLVRRGALPRSARVTAIPLGDGSARDVIRFDEPGRAHRSASSGVAEYAGWPYFTLGDFPSDIWVATVTGLAR